MSSIKVGCKPEKNVDDLKGCVPLGATHFMSLIAEILNQVFLLKFQWTVPQLQKSLSLSLISPDFLSHSNFLGCWSHQCCHGCARVLR